MAWGLYELTTKDIARVPAHLTTKCDLCWDGVRMQTIGLMCIAYNQGCEIYKNRPEVCRLFEAGSKQCRMARKRIGL